ncbi:MAG: hypothetical protein AAF413_00545 [Patescibacteria group bacterium]
MVQALKIWPIARVYTTLSTLSFLIPVVTALQYKLYAAALVIALATALSTLYHLYDEQNYQKIDKAGARLLILTNFYMLGHTTSFPIFTAAMVLALLAWYYYERSIGEYHINHSIWHLLSTAITTLCIYGYIS